MFKVRSDGEHLKEKRKSFDFFGCLHSLRRPVEFGKSKKSLFSQYKFEKRIRMLLIRMRMLPHTSFESPKNHSSLSTKFCKICTRAAVMVISQLTRASTPTSKVSAGAYT